MPHWTCAVVVTLITTVFNAKVLADCTSRYPSSDLFVFPLKNVLLPTVFSPGY
jgi:hypothetical protein